MRLLQQLRILPAAILLGLLAAASHAADSAPFEAETSVDVVKGRLFLDANANGVFDPGEKPLAGIRVTDSVHFVTTGEDGSYSITIADDSQIQYKPGRVVSVSWPSGKWPTGRWWRRLSEIKSGESVDFGLRDQEQKLPFLFAHITDDHGSGANYGAIGEVMKRQLGPMVRFCIATGDLGTCGPTLQENMRKFPVPMFSTPGNHDMSGRTAEEWKKPGVGTWAYTKYLGPVRWSFSYAGAHFSGVDWADMKIGSLESVPEVAAEWLDKDLQPLPAGTRKFLFVHFPNGCDRYYEVIARHKVTRIFAGHNHQHREYVFAGIPATTAINAGSRGGSLGVVQESAFDLVYFCGGCKADDYHNKRCGLWESGPLFASLPGRRGAHAETADKQIDAATYILSAGQGSAEVACTIVPGSAKRCGLRIGDRQTTEVVFSENVVWVAGAPVPYAHRTADKTLDWRVVVDGGQLTIRANDLFRMTKAVQVDNPSKVTLLAEGGGAMFKKVEVWNLSPPAAPAKAGR